MFIGRLAYTATFTRPNDAIAYTVGDLIANDTVAANVVPIFFRPTPIIGQPFKIRRIMCRKSTTNGNNIRINLFDSVPTYIGGDNTPIISNVRSAGQCIGSFTLLAADYTAFNTGGEVSSTACPENAFQLDSAFIWVVPEANNAYTPGALETFQFGFQIEL